MLLPARWENIAGLRFVIEVQLDLAGNELRQNGFYPALYGRLIRAVTGDKLLDNGLKRLGRKKCVRNTHSDCRTELQNGETREQLEVGNEYQISAN